MPTSWIQPNNQNSLMDTFVQAEALKAQRAQNALYAAKAAELPYEREREAKLNEANIGKVTAQTEQAKTATQGSELENAFKKMDLGVRILSQVHNEDSYQWAKQRAVAEGLPIDDLPESFDPAFVEHRLQSGMDMKDQIKARLDEQKFTERQKQSGIDNQFQQAHLGVAQGRLGLAQAGLGERRRHNQVMENKPGSGFSMTTNPDGTASFSYGTPAKNELEKKVISAEDARARLDEIKQSANSQNLTYQNQAKNALLDVKSKLGGEMTPEQATFRDSMTDTRQATLINVNKTIHELSGTAMGVKEAERIMATLPNTDDPPDVFDRKLENALRMADEEIARYKGALGVQPAAAPPPNAAPAQPSLEQMYDAKTAPSPAAAPQPSQKDYEYTAAKHGITIEEVKRRMGAR